MKKHKTAKALFISGTGTDVGKTYCATLVAKLLRDAGIDAGYYKPAASGVVLGERGCLESDAMYVARASGLSDIHEDMVSFSYVSAVSPPTLRRAWRAIRSLLTWWSAILRGFALGMTT